MTSVTETVVVDSCEASLLFTPALTPSDTLAEMVVPVVTDSVSCTGAGSPSPPVA